MLKVSHVNRPNHRGNLLLHNNCINILTFQKKKKKMCFRRAIHRAIPELCTRLLTGGERETHIQTVASFESYI